jgi:hypothetical protein
MSKNQKTLPVGHASGQSGKTADGLKNHNWEDLCRDQLEDISRERKDDVVANSWDHLQYGVR